VVVVVVVVVEVVAAAVVVAETVESSGSAASPTVPSVVSEGVIPVAVGASVVVGATVVVGASVVVGATVVVVVVVTTSFVKASSGRTISTSSSALSTTIDRVPDPAPPPEQPANKASATSERVKITRVRGRAIEIKRKDKLSTTGHRATDPHRPLTKPGIVMAHLA
jgi:hypothetical protein